VAAAFSGVFSIFAAEVLSTADEASFERWGIAAVYGVAETEPEIRVNGSSAVQVPISGGGSSTVFSGADTDVTMEQNLELAGVTLTWRAKKLRYNFSVSQIRRFELEFSSGPLTNSLRARDGFRAGLGVAGSFVPVSIASVGIGWNLDYRHLRAGLDRFASGGIVTSANQDFAQDEFQAAVTAAWRWKAIQPYAGLKIQRRTTRLTDGGTKESIRGTSDGVSPMVGVEWTPILGESGIIEASFVDEKSITASWLIKF